MNGYSVFAIVMMMWGAACSGRAVETHSPEPVPGKEQQSEIILTWRREGGFAGFCDEMQISTAGEVQIQTCRSRTERTGKLSTDDLNRLSEWRTSFGSLRIGSKDGGLADGMTVELTLKGTGGSQPTHAQEQEILEWAEKVYDRSKT
jgi:hypothetical protein